MQVTVVPDGIEIADLANIVSHWPATASHDKTARIWALDEHKG